MLLAGGSMWRGMRRQEDERGRKWREDSGRRTRAEHMEHVTTTSLPRFTLTCTRCNTPDPAPFSINFMLFHHSQIIDGLSERGDHPVVRMPLRQWVLKITEYVGASP